jgi:hypothetical protein
MGKSRTLTLMLYQSRVTGYGSNVTSPLTSGIASVIAWAINSLSNGSFW